MKGKIYPLWILLAVLLPGQIAIAQDFLGQGTLRGNFQTDIQISREDSLIGAPKVDEKLLMNSFANLIYTNQNLTVGLRFESYQNPLLGYDSRYKGSGVPYRFATYQQDWFEITAGNYYEQFGNGLVLRTYEDKNLGIDNSLDGARIVVKPLNGVVIKSFIGQQRFYWSKGPGIVRGIDGEVNLNMLNPKWSESATQLILGGSFVSKFQADRDPILKLPENVGAWATRMNLSRGGFNLSSEYAYKINDPSFENGNIYKEGHALVINASYSKSGLGLLLSAKHIDNMSFRSDRNAAGNDLSLNYLPALTRQHAYSLSGMYPYATQPNGEVGFLGELTYRIPKETVLGGPYGTTITLNYSRANELNKYYAHDSIKFNPKGTYGYEARLFDMGSELYFQDINLEINRRINSKLKGVFSYVYLQYNEEVIEGHKADDPLTHAHIGIIDLAYRLPKRKAIRTELQHLYTKQDNGSWAALLVEFTLSSKWFFALSDQYNYGNSDANKRIHYYTLSAGFNHQSSRISMAYGKQREGIICVGGVCRQVPASNGLMLTVSSSF